MTDLDNWENDIHCGDVRELLPEMPESSVHAVVTSPPYFGLRDYGEDGQIGLEESLDEYIDELVSVGEKIRRVLRDDGSWWLNLGDSFAGSGRGQWSGEDDRQKEAYTPDAGDLPEQDTRLRRKSKMLVPHRVAIALQDAGWIVRSDAVWSKPNPMPHPVKDRLNEHKEFIFHLVPNPDYYFDLDSIREPHKESSLERDNYDYQASMRAAAEDPRDNRTPDELAIQSEQGLHPNGKNPGDIFEVSTKPFPEAHFAVYPPELIEKPIKATVPEHVCSECGTPYERTTEELRLWERDPDNVTRPQSKRALELADQANLSEEHMAAARAVNIGDSDGSTGNPYDRVDEETAELARETKEVLGSYYREFAFSGTESHTTGFTQACECDTDETKAGIVLDPFAGAGTTCLVAKRLGRRFIGTELNPEYVAMAQKRVGIDVDEPERLLDDGETSLSAFLGDDQ